MGQKKTAMVVEAYLRRRAVLVLLAMVAALMLSSGVALAVTKSCAAGVECFGTKRADTLNGSDGNNLMYGKGRGDRLHGLGGNDWLYGEGGADKLFGGPGDDPLSGGPGNDALSGGEDNDYYYFADNWGKDTLTDGATPQNMVVFSNGPTNQEEVPVSEGLTINLHSGDGPEVKNASGTSTINWEANAIKVVVSGAGDDHITGNLSDNTITSNAGGADTISTGGGDDRINVWDGSGDDVVDCGDNIVIPGSGGTPDDDAVYYDPGDDVTNCEAHNPDL